MVPFGSDNRESAIRPCEFLHSRGETCSVCQDLRSARMVFCQFANKLSGMLKSQPGLVRSPAAAVPNKPGVHIVVEQKLPIVSIAELQSGAVLRYGLHGASRRARRQLLGRWDFL